MNWKSTEIWSLKHAKHKKAEKIFGNGSWTWDTDKDLQKKNCQRMKSERKRNFLQGILGEEIKSIVTIVRGTVFTMTMVMGWLSAARWNSVTVRLFKMMFDITASFL